MRDGFVLRHDPREVTEEKQPIEGAFLACSLWLADGYVLTGEIEKARALFNRVVKVANDLGLLAEEFDTGAGRQTGNFPQARTHIALIHTAHNLSHEVETRREALRAVAEDKGLTFQNALTPELWGKLIETSQDAVIGQYTIAASDVKGPFLAKLPAKMEDMKSLKRLGYTSAREALAEKFHMSEALLSALKPGKKFDRAGDMIFAAGVSNRPTKLTIGRIEVDKTRQTVNTFD